MKKNKVLRICKKVFDKLIDFVLHFIRRVITIIFNLLVALVCNLIWLITYEPGKRKKVTKRKAKRIVALTKLKLYAYKYCWWFFDYIRDDYMKKLYKTYSFLIEKK